MAEQVAARLLSQCDGFWEGILGRALSKDATTSLSDLQLTIVLPSTDEESFDQPIASVLVKELYGRRKLDCLGADFAVVIDNNVFRFQLKLGSSNMKKENFEEVRNRFRTNEQLASDAYRRLGLSIADNYVITTRSFAPNDAKASMEVKLIDSRILQEYGVWPDEVKALGKPFASKNHRTIATPAKFSAAV